MESALPFHHRVSIDRSLFAPTRHSPAEKVRRRKEMGKKEPSETEYFSLLLPVEFTA